MPDPGDPPIARKDVNMGAFEEVKGKVKQAAGDVTDNADLHREGEAQEGKADAEHQAAEARSEARQHEASAQHRERAEKAAQAER